MKCGKDDYRYPLFNSIQISLLDKSENCAFSCRKCEQPYKLRKLSYDYLVRENRDQDDKTCELEHFKKYQGKCTEKNGV